MTAHTRRGGPVLLSSLSGKQRAAANSARSPASTKDKPKWPPASFAVRLSSKASSSCRGKHLQKRGFLSVSSDSCFACFRMFILPNEIKPSIFLLLRCIVLYPEISNSISAESYGKLVMSKASQINSEILCNSKKRIGCLHIHIHGAIILLMPKKRWRTDKKMLTASTGCRTRFLMLSGCSSVQRANCIRPGRPGGPSLWTSNALRIALQEAILSMPASQEGGKLSHEFVNSPRYPALGKTPSHCALPHHFLPE